MHCLCFTCDARNEFLNREVLAFRCNQCKKINCLMCGASHDLCCEMFKNHFNLENDHQQDGEDNEGANSHAEEVVDDDVSDEEENYLESDHQQDGEHNEGANTHAEEVVDDDVSDEEENHLENDPKRQRLEEVQNSHAENDESGSGFYCAVCRKSYAYQSGFNRHLKERFHQQALKNQKE